MEEAVFQGEELAKFKRVRNPGQNDCLFHAVGQALRTAGIDRSVTTVAHLRSLVAKYITPDHYDILCAIWNSAKEERDFALINDYSFMQLGSKDIDTLKRVIRTQRYLGDEMALDILQAHLHVTLHVVDYQSDQCFRYCRRIRSSDSTRPTPWHVLLLQNKCMEPAHYELLYYNNRAVMLEKELPEGVRRVFVQREPPEKPESFSSREKVIA